MNYSRPLQAALCASVHCTPDPEALNPSTYVCLRTERTDRSGYSGGVFFFGGRLMSFGIYIVGYVIFIAGVAIGAHLLNAPLQWIGVGVLCLIGVAIVHGVTVTRHKDTPS